MFRLGSWGGGQNENEMMAWTAVFSVASVDVSCNVFNLWVQ